MSLALILTANCYAITLPEALTMARNNSPSIQKSQSITNESLWKKRENFSVFLPTISASATHLLSKKLALTNIRIGNSPTESIIPQIIPASQLNLTTTIPLFEGFSGLNRYQASVENNNATETELKWSMFKVEMEATLAFYKVLTSKILKDVAEKNLTVLQGHLKEVKLFKQSGMATNYDLLRVEVQVSNAETDLLNAIDNIAINEQHLIEILGLDQKNIEVSGELPVLTEKILDGITINDIHQRSDLKALSYHISSVSLSNQAQSSYWVPKILLLGNYQYYNNLNDSLTETHKFRSAYQVGLQLNWNIFDGLISFSKAKESIEQTIQAEKSYRLAELNAQKDFEIGKRKFKYYLVFFKARKNDIAKSTESVRLAREGLKVGVRTNTDLLDAEADLYKSEASAVNAQLGSVEALINLQTTIGKKIGIL